MWRRKEEPQISRDAALLIEIGHSRLDDVAALLVPALDLVLSSLLCIHTSPSGDQRTQHDISTLSSMPKEPTARPRRSTAGPTGELADHSYLHEPTWKTDTPRMRMVRPQTPLTRPSSSDTTRSYQIWKALAKSKYRLDDGDLKGYVHDRDLYVHALSRFWP